MNKHWVKYDPFKYLSMVLGYMFKGQYKWLSALIYPIAQLWRGSSSLIGWDDYRKRKYYESNVTGQTRSLQEHLNNELDNENRQIRIIHKRSSGLPVPLIPEGYETIDFSLTEENEAVYVALKGEIIENLDTGFIVLIPSYVNKDKVTGIVNEYKLAGKTYKVEIN